MLIYVEIIYNINRKSRSARRLRSAWAHGRNSNINMQYVIICNHTHFYRPRTVRTAGPRASLYFYNCILVLVHTHGLPLPGLLSLDL